MFKNLFSFLFLIGLLIEPTLTQELFMTPDRFVPFVGKFKVSKCSEFKSGALVDIKYAQSLMTRYEIPYRWVPGLIITSDWYPYKGYDGNIVRHQRIYHIHELQRTTGYYKTFFSIKNDHLIFKIIEVLESGASPIVRSHVELLRQSRDEMKFYNYRNGQNHCRLLEISSDEYQVTLEKIGKSTSGDYY